MSEKPKSGGIDTERDIHDPPTCPCKVGQLARDHNLGDINSELTRRWHGKGTERQSLREVADYFNTEVFRDILSSTDADVLETQISHFYEILTGDTATQGERVEVANQLSTAGIDIERLQKKKFVSYQTIHNHFLDCLEIPPPDQQSSQTTSRSDQESLRAIRTRTERIAESMVERNLNGRVDDSLEISVNVMARCDDCGYNKPVTTILEDGGCECAEPTLTD